MLLCALFALVLSCGGSPSATNKASPPPLPSTVETLDGRSYRLLLPTAPVTRVIIALHAYTQSADSFERVLQLDATAMARSWAVVYPQGEGNSWNAGTCCGAAERRHIDDMAFLRRLLAVTLQHAPPHVPVDLIGYSNGGMLALQWACSDSKAFSSVTSVSSSLQATHCTRTPRFFIVRGERDTTIPISGGFSPALHTQLLPDSVGLDALKAATHCGPTVTSSPMPTGTTTTFRCGSRTVGTYVTLSQQGHLYPTPTSPSPFDTTGAIVDFITQP